MQRLPPSQQASPLHLRRFQCWLDWLGNKYRMMQWEDPLPTVAHLLGAKTPCFPRENGVTEPCLLRRALSSPLSVANLRSALDSKAKWLPRLQCRAAYLPVSEIEVFVHVHPERGGLQAVQADDAVLGAPDFDIVYSEEPLTVGIRLERRGGLWVTAQGEPGGLPKTNCPAPMLSVHFHQVRAPVHEGVWSDRTCPTWCSYHWAKLTGIWSHNSGAKMAVRGTASKSDLTQLGVGES